MYRIIVMATSVVRVMKMGNIVPRVKIEPISLAFWVSMLTITPPSLPDVTTLPTPTCLKQFLAKEVNADYFTMLGARNNPFRCSSKSQTL